MFQKNFFTKSIMNPDLFTNVKGNFKIIKSELYSNFDLIQIEEQADCGLTFNGSTISFESINLNQVINTESIYFDPSVSIETYGPKRDVIYRLKYGSKMFNDYVLVLKENKNLKDKNFTRVSLAHVDYNATEFLKQINEANVDFIRDIVNTIDEVITQNEIEKNKDINLRSNISDEAGEQKEDAPMSALINDGTVDHPFGIFDIKSFDLEDWDSWKLHPI
eukprot:497671_1